MCNVDGNQCVCKCKSGYVGEKCQSCEAEELIVSGKNDVIDKSKGHGVKCSMYNQYFHYII